MECKQGLSLSHALHYARETRKPHRHRAVYRLWHRHLPPAWHCCMETLVAWLPLVLCSCLCSLIEFKCVALYAILQNAAHSPSPSHTHTLSSPLPLPLTQCAFDFVARFGDLQKHFACDNQTKPTLWMEGSREESLRGEGLVTYHYDVQNLTKLC